MLRKQSSQGKRVKIEIITSNSRGWTLKNEISFEYLWLETILPVDWVGPLGKRMQTIEVHKLKTNFVNIIDGKSSQRQTNNHFFWTIRE